MFWFFLLIEFHVEHMCLLLKISYHLEKMVCLILNTSAFNVFAKYYLQFFIQLNFLANPIFLSSTFFFEEKVLIIKRKMSCTS